MSAVDPWLAGVVAPLLGCGPLPPPRAREAAAPGGDEPVRIIVNARDAETRPLTALERQAIDQRRIRVAQERAIVAALGRGESLAAIAARLGIARSTVDRIARTHGPRPR